MFEKDAEEYYETETPMIENITGLDFQNEVTKAFQKGAEFGYNKAKKESEEQIEKMKCCGNCTHRHYWGNELGCNLDLDKQFECDNNNKKYWEFMKE